MIQFADILCHMPINEGPDMQSWELAWLAAASAGDVEETCAVDRCHFPSKMCFFHVLTLGEQIFFRPRIRL